MLRADHEIDAVGLICPEPLMLVRNRVRGMTAGQVVHVVATDPAADRDFRDFCRFLGHELVDTRKHGDRLEFWIRKGPV
jgi:tRNA 2-thiouridine synthesizing protein A